MKLDLTDAGRRLLRDAGGEDAADQRAGDRFDKAWSLSSTRPMRSRTWNHC
jgi:hypothetical protein